jgi:hypothetical protein
MVVFSLFSVMINGLLTGFLAQFAEIDARIMGIFMVGQATNALLVLII